MDEAVPVGTCLTLFGRWLQEMRDNKGFKFPCDQVHKKDQETLKDHSVKWCTFVTWSGIASRQTDSPINYIIFLTCISLAHRLYLVCYATLCKRGRNATLFMEEKPLSIVAQIDIIKYANGIRLLEGRDGQK